MKYAALLLFLVSAVLLTDGTCHQLNTVPCESTPTIGELLSFTINEPHCTSAPCKFVRNTTFSVDIKFKSKTTCKELTFIWYVVVENVTIQVGGDVCKDVRTCYDGKPRCPIIDGDQTLCVKYTDAVPPNIPTFKATSKAMLLCDHKEAVICLKIDVKVV